MGLNLWGLIFEVLAGQQPGEIARCVSIYTDYGMWRSLVARCFREAEVVGSIPAIPIEYS
ncbi:MAG: hypothetical protein RLZZ04_488 [Cyanobacteriota bacterium]